MSRPKPQQLPFENNRSYSQITPDSTPEFEAFKAYEPDKTLLNQGTTSVYDTARRGITEGTNSPYSGINPVLRARLQQLGLQELATKESGDLADADLDREKLKMEQLAMAMNYKRPQVVESRSSGYNSQLPQGGGTGAAIGGIASGAGMVIAAF